MLSRAPEFKIGLENDIMCGLIYVKICQRWTYVSHNQDSDAPSWELISLNIIGRTNELVLYVIVIVLIVA